MKARRLAILGIAFVAMAALLLAGCRDGYSSPLSPTRTVPAFTSPLQGTADAIALERYATQSAAEVGAAEAQAQATMQAAIYQATAQAAEAHAKQQRWLATQQAARVTAHAQATADAFAMQMTAQAQAIEATATERAYRATATAQALDREATATAQHRADVATATGQAAEARATATRAAWEGKTTATAESYRATQAAYQATATRQAQKREEVLGYGRDYGIPAVLLFIAGCLVALVIYGLRQHARRPVVYQRSPLGDAPALAAPTPGGGWNIIDLDRQPGHVTRLLPDGHVETPQFRSAGQEERTTARDQAVDATTRPKLGAGHRGGQTPALPVAPPPTPPAPGLRSVRILRRLDQAERAGFLPGPLVASLQADWEVEQ